MRPLFLIIILIPLVAFDLEGATLKVPGQYPTIQQAIDAAVKGDVVQVDPGTYVENIDFKGKEIKVESTGGPVVTVIDGGQAGSVVTFQSLETSGTVLDGFTITNGTGTPGHYGTYRCGCGIYCLGSAPVIRNNIITKNLAPPFPLGALGIGVYCEQSGAHIYENEIVENGNPLNNQSHYGGGIACWQSTCLIRLNTIKANAAEQGGGLYFYSSGNQVKENAITENRAGWSGGGLYCGTGSVMYITGNTITKNSSEEDGGS